MKLKYFTIYSNEDIPSFLKRVRVSTRTLDLAIQSVSPVMSKGVIVITLLSNNLSDTIKLEVYQDQVDELKSYFNHINNNKNVPKLKGNRADGLDDIGDFFK